MGHAPPAQVKIKYEGSSDTINISRKVVKIYKDAIFRTISERNVRVDSTERRLLLGGFASFAGGGGPTSLVPIPDDC